MQQYEVLEFSSIKKKISQYAQFSLGKEHILQLEPTFKKLILQRDLQLLKESCDFYNHYGNIPFGGIYNIEEAVLKAEKGMILVPQEFMYIAFQSKAIQTIEAFFKDNQLQGTALKDLVQTLSAFPKLQKEIERCIDEQYQIKDDASSTLRQIRSAIKEKERGLQHVMQGLIAKHSGSLMESIATYRNDRLCLLVKVSDKNKIKGIIHAESASGLAVYLEPVEAMEVNNVLQNLHYEEYQEIERILTNLSEMVKVEAQAILGNLQVLTLLDSFFARAAYARANEGCVATVQENQDRIYIKNGRHPLIDPKNVVSNTYDIPDQTRTLLISGPNTGGKTVTLKTIGVFVLMTYAGCPILAQEALFPMFDQLFVDIGDSQSIEMSLSTFSAHLAKLAQITSNCTPNSLVLLDELGSGTDPNEGEALAMAILSYLLGKNVHVIATTHYAKLKNYANTNQKIMISCVEFDMVNLQPTYRFLPHISGQSNAFDIALRYGLPQAIVEDARMLKESNKTESERSMEQLETLIYENELMKQELESQSEAMATALANTKNMETSMEKQKNHILRQANEQAKKILDEASEEAQEVIDEIRQSQEAKPHELLQMKSRLKKYLPEDEHVEVKPAERDFVVGDYVLFKKYNYYGEITSISGKKVSILTNGMKMNTTIDELELAKKQVASKKKDKGKISDSFNKAFSMELNLLGYRVDEALAMVDKYLDNALYAKVYDVRIVHGVGTGALRKAVQSYLKTSKLVEHYHYGMQSEGGLGATIVKLKRKK